MTTSRKPNRFEMTFLFAFHGALTAGVLLTYVSEDDVYFLHQFAGYVVCGAIALRLMAAALAPKNSPLALSLPNPLAARAGGRHPIYKWIAVALIAVTGLAAFSGVAAEWTGVFEDLHEGLAEGVLPLVIFGHMAVVLYKPVMRRLGGIRAEDLDAALARAWDWATRAATFAADVVQRVKPIMRGQR